MTDKPQNKYYNRTMGKPIPVQYESSRKKNIKVRVVAPEWADYIEH